MTNTLDLGDYVNKTGSNLYSYVYNCVVEASNCPCNPITKSSCSITGITESLGYYSYYVEKGEYKSSAGLYPCNTSCYFAFYISNSCFPLMADYSIYIYIYWNNDGTGFKNLDPVYSTYPPTLGTTDIYGTQIDTPSSYVTVTQEINTLTINILQLAMVNICVILPSNCRTTQAYQASINVTTNLTCSSFGSYENFYFYPTVYNCVVETSNCPCNPITNPSCTITGIRQGMSYCYKGQDAVFQQSCDENSCYFSSKNGGIGTGCSNYLDTVVFPPP